MSDGLNVNYSINNYEDSLNNYPINNPESNENSAIFSQVKNIVKGTIFNNSKELVPSKDFKSRFVSLRGGLNNKLKNIFHGVSKSFSEEREVEEESFEGKEKSEEELSSEKKGLDLEPEIDSSDVESSKKEDIGEKNELEKREKKEFKEKELGSENKEINDLKDIDVQESDKGKIEEENFQENEIKENKENLEESTTDTTNEEKENKVDSFSEKTEVSEDLLKENEKTESTENKKEEEFSNVKDVDNSNEEQKIETEDNIKEEVRLAEDSEGDSISEIEQMEIQKEEKKEEHEESHEKEEIEKKEEDVNLLPEIDKINNLENNKEEYNEEEKKKDKEEKNVIHFMRIPLELISFIKQNLSKILSHKNYSIDSYNCVFYAEDVSVFFLKQFSDIMITIFRSSVSSMEAEKIYQTRQKAKKFIQENNLSFLQISDDKLLIINSDYGPIKILLEKRLSSGFVLSDLVGNSNYKANKYVLKEALQQFVIFMCDFGLSSGFRYKLRILPNQAPKPSSIALYCSYSISLANNFKLFKETISILSKEDFDFVFQIIESKLDNKKSNKILNYWRLKQ